MQINKKIIPGILKKIGMRPQKCIDWINSTRKQNMEMREGLSPAHLCNNNRYWDSLRLIRFEGEGCVGRDIEIKSPVIGYNDDEKRMKYFDSYTISGRFSYVICCNDKAYKQVIKILESL